VSGFDWFWLLLASLQVGVAFYTLFAALRWRGARLWPSAEAPFGPLLWGLVVLLVGSVGGLLWRIADVEFTRWVGTGSLMVAALVVLALLRGRVEREAAVRRAAALRATAHRKVAERMQVVRSHDAPAPGTEDAADDGAEEDAAHAPAPVEVGR
jgi:hypothetical protein